MSLGAALSGKPLAVEVKASPLSVDDAAAMMLKAVHDKDVKAIASAMRLGYEACKDESESDGDKSYSDDED